MGKPQSSFSKRQREQTKRDRQQMKAEKRAQRKNEPTDVDADGIALPETNPDDAEVNPERT